MPPDCRPFKGGKAYAAPTAPSQTPLGQAMVFILPPFWSEQPWAQSFTFVHELSHELEGGLKEDVVYKQEQCENLASFTSADAVGKVLNRLLYPDLPPNLTPDAAMKNADSFAFFVYFVAKEKQE